MSEKYIVGEPVDGRGFWAVLDRYSKVRCSPRFTEKTEAEAHLAEMLRDEQADTEGAPTMPTTLTYSSDRFQVFRNDTTGEFEVIALTDAQPSVKVRGHDATVLRDSLADIAAAGRLADGYLASYFPTADPTAALAERLFETAHPSEAETLARVTGSVAATVVTEHGDESSEEHWERVGARSDAEQAATDELVARRNAEHVASAYAKLTVAEMGALRAQLRAEALRDAVAAVRSMKLPHPGGASRSHTRDAAVRVLRELS